MLHIYILSQIQPEISEKSYPYGNYVYVRSGEYWRSKHHVSWRQMILTTLPPHHTRQERQEEELCRKFERLYQKNKNYERKCNRYSGSGLRITPDVSTLTKTYWDYPQAKVSQEFLVAESNPSKFCNSSVSQSVSKMSYHRLVQKVFTPFYRF